jgi:dinuclear metal center YbgI/SA1388 family protein
MANLTELIHHLERLLQTDAIRDYCPNGLQVQGKTELKKLVTGVSASQALIDAAIAQKADAILVHHGYFWKGEDPRVIGIKQQRLKSLLQHNISLLAYHLPLDIHPEYGNNVQLAQLLNLELTAWWKNEDGLACIAHGHLLTPVSPEKFVERLTQSLKRAPLHIPGSQSLIKTIAWCTGAAQDFIDIAIAHQVDAYLTGEVSERTVLQAREAGIHFFAAGHHATERYGVKALGEHLAKEFGIEHQFIDIENPV